jgi:hypothetical protein
MFDLGQGFSGSAVYYVRDEAIRSNPRKLNPQKGEKQEVKDARKDVLLPM